MLIRINLTFPGESPHGIVANMLDCDFVVSEFEHQSHCCIHFWTNALGKVWIP